MTDAHRTVVRPSLYFSAGVLACAGLLGGVWHLGWIRNELLDAVAGVERASIEVVDSSLSPTQKYVATTHKVSDNSGWCELRTNVHSSNQAFDWEREFVLIADCDSRLELKWNTNTDLTIFYSDGNPDNGIKTYQQFRSEDGLVKISYILKQ